MNRHLSPAISSKTIAAYIRVSTEEQSSEGVSLEAQETRVKAFCVASGRVKPVIVRDAGQSAKSLNRDGLQSILGGIQRREIGTLVVLKLDRLTRSVGDLAFLLTLLEKHECALVAVEESLDTSSASGRLMLHLLASVSQWEREVISERTASAFDYKRSLRQVYCKAAPFGFKREGKTLVEVPEQIAAIKTMKRLASEGLSLRKIGAHLTDMGVSPTGGGKWFPQSVKVVLNSKMTASLEP